MDSVGERGHDRIADVICEAGGGRTLLAEGGVGLVRSDAAEKCALLSSLGINLNLAPVADIYVGI